MNRAERRKEKKIVQKSPQHYINQAVDHMRNNRHDLACGFLKEALRLAPNNRDSLANMGECLRVLKRYPEAMQILERLVKNEPNFIYGHINLGAVYGDLLRCEEAIAHFLKAVEIDPSFTLSYMNLSELYRRTGQLENALKYSELALARKPNDLGHLLNRGTVLKDVQRFDEAMECFNKALKTNQTLAEVWVNVATTDLIRGNLLDGFRNFEWRIHYPIFSHLRPERFPKPRWSGEDLNGKTILLYGEQGYGDAIQFIRYVPLLVERGAKVYVWMFDPLIRLFQTVPGVAGVYRTIQEIPEYDYHCSEMSLPHLLKTSLDTIPNIIPYVFAEPDKVEYWKQKLSKYEGLKIGITWAGNPGLSDDILRSASIEQIRPLLEIKGATFFSLQKNVAAKQLNEIPENIRPIDFMDEINDFLDSAALVENLDLVIAVDTSIVHLAGALGKPVWIMSRYSGCWRWLLNREDTPWYPSAKLYRMIESNNWAELIERVHKDLTKEISKYFSKKPVDMFITV